MFVTYPSQAAANNWIHDSICSAFNTICRSINSGGNVPDWPNVLPVKNRDALKAKRALPKKLATFTVEAKKLSDADRTKFLDLLEQQNQIAGLLDGSVSVPVVSKALKPLVAAAKAVCDEGFLLLAKTKVRNAQYKIIWDNFKNKTCPFCGCEPFDSPTLHREDADHYLARSIYPLAAANLYNLVPMGGKCNSLYKGKKDILYLKKVRRKALNPYGNDSADISLLNSIPFGSPNDIPKWKIDLVPNSEEVRTWENVFSIRKRLTDSVLSPYFFIWLSELTGRFEEARADDRIDDAELIHLLEKHAAYAKKYKEAGPGFLKDKVFEMLAYHCRIGNHRLIAMIRSSLPKAVVPT